MHVSPAEGGVQMTCCAGSSSLLLEDLAPRSLGILWLQYAIRKWSNSLQHGGADLASRYEFRGLA